MAVTLELEKALGDSVMGIDEAGRGPLVGGVYAAAVSVPLALAESLLAGAWREINDSKKLTEKKRGRLAEVIKSTPGCRWAVASASPKEIDELNILNATHLAMRRAADQVGADHILVDGLPVKTLPGAVNVVKGDAKSLLIAAASILAKTTRDADCLRLERLYPGYGFAKHKGYPTKAHLDALARLGPCPEHRMSFGPVAESVGLFDKTANLIQRRGEEQIDGAPLTFLDGGFGTMVQAAGLPPGKDPTDWNVENPEAVAAVHRAYVEAGANIVLANTFGANRLKYHGPHPLDKLISSAISLARLVGTGAPARPLGDRAREGACPYQVGTGAPARPSGHRVALDIGPTGRLLKPAGDLDFDTAYEAFAEMVRIGAAAGADLVFVETMGDTRELKAAVLAAKLNSSLPVYATVSLDESGKLLTGASVECVAALLESLGVDAYGFNCGLGPDKMLPFVERLAKVTTKPIIVKANAGMPKLVDGKTVFDVGPGEFAAYAAKLVEAGASIVGGCCGTTPAHIAAVRDSCFAIRGSRSLSSRATSHEPRTTVSSGTSVVALEPHGGLIVGERINPTGKKLLKEAYLRGDTAYVLREAVKQTDAGAEILDVNCGVPGIDEAATLERTVETVQSVVTCPIQIDTADPDALERALRRVNGKPLVNSVNGKRESMDAVFPLVRKYGGALVALCLDESGIPDTSDGRLAIARRILDEGAKYGFGKDDFVFDALTLAVSADPKAAIVTIETVRRLTEELGVNTILGVSNVSFGLPNRPALNNAMYTLCVRAGLSAAIANPSLIRESDDAAAFDVLLGRDKNCERWIAANVENAATKAAAAPASADAAGALGAAIRRGLRDDASKAAAEMLSGGATPMEVIEKGIVPALEQVGAAFEKGTAFLPQLLMAADAAGDAFAVVRKNLAGRAREVACPYQVGTGAPARPSHACPSQETMVGTGAPARPSHACPSQETMVGTGAPARPQPRPIVIATVKGDIHDIGKNIVRALLENYGFDVIDLGRDVAPETIVERARAANAGMVGLSALMTTTVGAMAETIRQLKAAGLDAKTFVGGAVVTQDYADSIGADFYAKDAMQSVRIAERVLRGA